MSDFFRLFSMAAAVVRPFDRFNHEGGEPVTLRMKYADKGTHDGK